ncbi:MAG: hypothetical protein MZU95_14210 [Desulfomicrobium escambiense]|nr:hypothetical protein [Desulfomicrobium escambiense]
MFLDRDDTLIRDAGYLSDPDGIELLPGAAEASVRAEPGGHTRPSSITNQSGIARGLFDEEDPARRSTHRLLTMLTDAGRTHRCHLLLPPPPGRDQWRSTACPAALPQARAWACCCKAAQDFGLDLAACSLVGDKAGRYRGHPPRGRNRGTHAGRTRPSTLDHTPEYIAAGPSGCGALDTGGP